MGQDTCPRPLSALFCLLTLRGGQIGSVMSHIPDTSISTGPFKMLPSHRHVTVVTRLGMSSNVNDDGVDYQFINNLLIQK